MLVIITYSIVGLDNWVVLATGDWLDIGYANCMSKWDKMGLGALAAVVLGLAAFDVWVGVSQPIVALNLVFFGGVCLIIVGLVDADARKYARECRAVFEDPRWREAFSSEAEEDAAFSSPEWAAVTEGLLSDDYLDAVTKHFKNTTKKARR